MPAKIGVEQGVPASAKSIPINNGYKKTEFVLLEGIDLINVGIPKSKTSKSLSPITIKSEATSEVKYAPNADAKTLPVMAHTTPMTVNTIAVPKIKEESCNNVLNGVSLEYPPT